MNIFLLIRFFLHRLPSRKIVEFGSYRGATRSSWPPASRSVTPGPSSMPSTTAAAWFRKPL